MACFDHSLTGRPSLARRLAALWETPFDRRQRRLSARVAALRALSDAELAQLGLLREDILYHVFSGRP